MLDSGRDEALARRVRRLEIRTELSDLVANYGDLLDSRNWDGVAASFARNGTLSFPGGSVTSRSAVRAYYADRLSAYDFTYHYPHSQRFEIADNDYAAGIVTGHAEHALNGTCLLAAVRYVDRYAHEDGQWRFASRQIISRYLLSWQEFNGSFREGAVTTFRP